MNLSGGDIDIMRITYGSVYYYRREHEFITGEEKKNGLWMGSVMGLFMRCVPDLVY